MITAASSTPLVAARGPLPGGAVPACLLAQSGQFDQLGFGLVGLGLLAVAALARMLRVS